MSPQPDFDFRAMRPTIEQLRAVDRENARIVVRENKDEFERIFRHALALAGLEV